MEKNTLFFFKVNVAELFSAGNEDSLENNKKILLRVSLNEQESWQVYRSNEDVKEFYQKLQSDGYLDSYFVPSYLAEDVEKVINEIATRVNGQLWKSAALSKFIDDNYGKSPLITAQFLNMEKQIFSLSQTISTYQQRLESIDSVLQRMSTNSFSVDDSSKLVEKVPKSPGVSAVAYEIDSSENNDIVLEGIADRNLDKSGCESPVSNDNADLSAESTSVPLKQYFDTTSTYENTQHYVAWDPLEENDAVSVGSSTEPMENSFFSGGLLTTNVNDSMSGGDSDNFEELTISQEQEIDALLMSIQPHETQIQYRQSAISLLKRQIRLALGTVSFEIGLYQLRCFLPADPIKLTVIVSQPQIPLWHTTLAERLKQAADSGVDLIGRSNDVYTMVDMVDESQMILPHNIRNISFINENNTSYKVVCALDSLDVEISVNNRYELCTLTFIEELDEIIKQDHLLKRSILLIRSWWFYETANYVKTQVKHYLNDFSLCIMIINVFNRYYMHITSPLLALLFFLREYSTYDGRTSVITIQGTIPFSNETSNMPVLPKMQSNHLIKIEMMEKYWQLFNVQDPLNIEPPSGVARPPPNPQMRHQMLFSSMTKALSKFERYGFNIMHPFTMGNLIEEKLSSRRLGLLSKVFSIGYIALTTALKQIKENPTYSRDIVKSYLPTILSRFGSQWRPDAVGNTVLLPNRQEFSTPDQARELLNVALEKLMQNILYCNFIVESIISESAILSFCMDTLVLKGPLPAGEVGKLLSEAASIPNLSHKLREKFGGLKKFLERYPEIFVFSNDHPFNPHVLLRNTLSQENLDLIYRGVFPYQLIAKNGSPSTATVPGISQPPGAASPSMNGMPGNQLPVTLPTTNNNMPNNSVLNIPTGLSNTIPTTHGLANPPGMRSLPQSSVASLPTTGSMPPPAAKRPLTKSIPYGTLGNNLYQQPGYDVPTVSDNGGGMQQYGGMPYKSTLPTTTNAAALQYPGKPTTSVYVPGQGYTKYATSTGPVMTNNYPGPPLQHTMNHNLAPPAPNRIPIPSVPTGRPPVVPGSGNGNYTTVEHGGIPYLAPSVYRGGGGAPMPSPPGMGNNNNRMNHPGGEVYGGNHFDMNELSLAGNSAGNVGSGGNNFLSSLRDNASEFFPSDNHYDQSNVSSSNNSLFGSDNALASVFGRGNGGSGGGGSIGAGSGAGSGGSSALGGNANPTTSGIEEGFQLGGNALDGLHNYGDYSQFSNY